jgi:IclR family KDG regulon transcriptional repressor
MVEKKAVLNQSVERMLRIVEDMAAHGRCRLQDIAERVNLPPSTVLRMINTLRQYGYAAQESQAGLYFLTLKFVQLGEAIISKTSLHGVTRAELQRLVKVCDESCSVGIEQGGEVVYVDVLDRPDGILKTTQRIGKIAPLHTTGIGKMLLLNYSEEQIRERYLRTKLTRLTPNSIGTVDDLLAELRKVRELGYALDNEECELGVRCVAMAIRDGAGKVVAGISISGPVHRMTDKHIQQHLPALEQAVAAIERI